MPALTSTSMVTAPLAAFASDAPTAQQDGPGALDCPARHCADREYLRKR